MTDILRKPRSLTMVSVALFLVAYLAILLIVLAPKDLLTATPGSQHQTDN